METFYAGITAKVRGGKGEDWKIFEMSRSPYSCRDSFLYWAKERSLCRVLGISNLGDLDFEHPPVQVEISDIKIDFELHPRVKNWTSYEIFHEISQALEIKVEKEKEIKDPFYGNIKTVLSISGNDRTALLAIYWIVLAMRGDIIAGKGSFIDRMGDSGEYTIEYSEDIETSMQIWQKILEKKFELTSEIMVQTGQNPIYWEHWKLNPGQ